MLGGAETRPQMTRRVRGERLFLTSWGFNSDRYKSLVERIETVVKVKALLLSWGRKTSSEVEGENECDQRTSSEW
jgi:hypothetical protein